MGLIVFSHLLSPRDVGLIAMVAVFLTLGELIRDFGISQAAIQTDKLTHDQASNLFWTNALVGFVLTIALVCGAPMVARMYSEPALLHIAPWVAVSFTINAIQSQFQVRLARDLRFVALTVTDMSSQAIGLIAGIMAALSGLTYWSLVVQMLLVYVSLLLQRALIAGWYPGLPRRASGMKALYLFGLHSGLSQLMSYFASNTDTYVIGIRWGAAALGVYNRAFQMFTVPANQLLGPLTNVLLPIMSQRRHRGGDFYPLLWKVQVVISASLSFVFALAAALAQPIVDIVLGSAWTEAAPLLSILAIGGAVQTLSYINLWAFLASGNARHLFLSSLVTRPLLIVCILAGSLGGIRGVAWGFSAGLSVSWLISLAWLRRCDSAPAAMFLSAGVRVLSASFVSGALGWIIISKLEDRLSVVFLLLAGFSVVAGVYLSLVIASADIRRALGEVVRPTVDRARSVVLRRSQ